MTKTENRSGGPASLRRHWPSWIVLLCLGLMPAGDARCFAADPVPPPAPVPTVPQKAKPEVPFLEITGGFLDVAPAAVAPPAQPAAKNGSLLGALDEAIDAVPPPPQPSAGADVLEVYSNLALPQAAVTVPEPARVKPAAKKGSLLGALDDALDDDPKDQKVEPEAAEPEAKKGSLLGGWIEAFGGGNAKNRAAAQAAEDQNVRNLEAGFRAQFQQALYGELAFLRRVCKPDAKPFAELARAANADLRVPLREYASQYWAMMNGRAGSSGDPHSGIRKLLMPLVAAKLGPEKALLYRQECDKRAEARKHAVVLNVVAELDERLLLTAPQRVKLVESLSANYQPDWDSYMAMLDANNPNNLQRYLPSIREESIVPLLDEQQKGVWAQAGKLGGQQFFGQIMQQNPRGGQAAEIQEIKQIVEEVKDGR